jgi:transposase
MMDRESLGRLPVAELVELVLRQQATIAALGARVQALEDRLATDSHNSSKPPSGDGSAKKTRSLRGPSGRRPGGQAGHPGHRLALVEAPDAVEAHRPAACRACGGSLAGGEVAAVERRQVFELPPLRLEVTEHRAETVCCPRCGAETAGEFPEGVGAPAQYGPRLRALGVYLMAYHLLPYARTAELLADLFGAAPGEGALHTALARCHTALAPIEEAIEAGLRAAAVLHCDETSVRVGGKRWWLHAAGTAALTHYAVDRRRGKAATDAIGILPAFAGRAVHDAWAAYAGYACAHALCNAHLLRELVFLVERAGQAWAAELIALLLELKARVAEARAAGAAALAPGDLRDFEGRYARILADGFAANPPPPPPPPATRGRPKRGKALSLLDRLDARRDQVLAFARDFRVPFDNNLAERDLRMVKVQQKVSGTFRSEDGAAYFCRVRGYLSTLRKQGHDLLAALTSTFQGHPLTPAFAGPE